MCLVFPFLFNFIIPSAYRAIALWPFIFVKHSDLKLDPILLNHERIHLKQQLECLIIPFYLIYLVEYVYYRFKRYGHHKAYRSISFEQEAYKNESNLNYLVKRKVFGNFR